MGSIVYLIRHGEVGHHRADVGLTAGGYEQASAAGAALAGRLAEGDSVRLFHSPVTRVRETAELIHASLLAALRSDGRAERVILQPPQPDEALCNVRFILGPGREPQEPSLLFAEITHPANLLRFPRAQGDFYRGFWASRDPMGFWLAHDSGGGAETPATVLARLQRRLKEIFEGEPAEAGRAHWLMVTHSGAMRVLLREALGADPGEPDFCEMAVLEPASQVGEACLWFRDRGVLVALQ